MSLQNNDSYIGQLLLKDGIITDEELKLGLLEQQKNKGFLCSTIVRLGFASEEKIYSILSLQMGIPFLDLQDIKIDDNILNYLPGNFAMAYLCLPLKVIDEVIYVAMADPLDAKIIEEIKTRLPNTKVRIFLAGENAIRQAIKAHYGL